MKRWFCILTFVCFGPCAVWAQFTIFVTRHADRFGTEPDPSLTPLGMRQAKSLGRMLADANIQHIYTTELLRTQQTAAPTARLAHIAPIIVPQKQFDALIEKIRSTARDHESTLVVGHRETAPRIVKALTGETIAPMGSGDYGRLIVITCFPDGRSSVITLHYGD